MLTRPTIFDAIAGGAGCCGSSVNLRRARDRPSQADGWFPWRAYNRLSGVDSIDEESFSSKELSPSAPCGVLDERACWGHPRKIQILQEENPYLDVAGSSRRESAIRTLCGVVLLAAPALGCAFLVVTVLERGWSLGLSAPEESVRLQYDCGLREDGLDYITRGLLHRAMPIHGPEECQRLCQNEARCGTWTWGKAENELAIASICWLKALEKYEEPELRYNPATFSGIACRGMNRYSENRTLHRERSTPVDSNASRHMLGKVEVPERPVLSGRGCGQLEESTGYWTSNILYELSPLMAARHCQAKCKAEPRCSAWTWGRPGAANSLVHSVCYLLGNGSNPVSFHNPDMVSGRACKDDVAERSDPATLPEDGEPGVVENWSRRPTFLCDLMEHNAEYGSNSSHATTLRNVGGADDCRRYCKGTLQCGAWSWRPGSAEDAAMGLGMHGVCRLLSEVAPNRVRRHGYVSGLTCHQGTVDGDGVVDIVDNIDVLDDDSRSWIARNMGPPDAFIEGEQQRSDGGKFLNRLAGGASIDEIVQVCPSPEPEVDFDTKAELAQWDHVQSAAACQHACTDEEDCGAWSWGAGDAVPQEGITYKCWLKRLAPGATVDRSAKANIVSGYPCRNESRSSVDANDYMVIVGDGNWVEELNSIGGSRRHYPNGSLYCFALMQPEGYEKGLVRMQYHMRTSLFACDEPAVFSDRIIDIVPGFQTHVVDSDLKCEYGGEFKTALNTPIFLAVWTKVVNLGRFKLHDWTVKVDPDCVFAPDRLRARLDLHKPGQAMYLNNCHYGLHGPIEVLSKEAVQVWIDGKDRCATAFQQMCSGDCLWGEDIYLDQCFMTVLTEVRREDDFDMLLEDHCDPPDDWGPEECRDQGKVAYHPFKTEDGYRVCLAHSGQIQLLSF